MVGGALSAQCWQTQQEEQYWKRIKSKRSAKWWTAELLIKKMVGNVEHVAELQPCAI